MTRGGRLMGSSSTAQSFEVPTHAPDSPFGCVAQWGPPIGAFYVDLALHVCNEDDGHEGGHLCKCGETADNIGQYLGG